MKTSKFIRSYLKDKAKVSIVTNVGDVMYEGDVRSLPWKSVKDTEVVDVRGLGGADDLVIQVMRIGGNQDE